MKLKKRYFSPIVVIFLIAIFGNSCMKMRTSDKKTYKEFEKKNTNVFIDRFEDIRFVKSDTLTSKTALLFVHGTPGSADAFYEYLSDSSLTSQFTCITYDRPGYGYSNYGKAQTSITKQSALVANYIKRYDSVIVVGHSFGGPIAAHLLCTLPNVKAGMMLAPAISPMREKFTGGAKLGNSFIGRIFLSKAMIVACQEKLSHKESLLEVEPLWQKLEKPIIYIHSTDDKIVPFQPNHDYVKKQFQHADLEIKILNEGDHFIPWNHYNLVHENIIKLNQSK